MYKKGTSCSACPQGSSCSATYPGLCDTGSPSSILPATTRRPTRKTTRRTSRRTTTTTKPKRKSTTTRSTTTRRTTRRTTTRRTTRKPIRKPPVSAVNKIPTKEVAENKFNNSTLDASLLFTCDFQDKDNCNVRNTGIDWERVENGEGNVFYET